MMLFFFCLSLIRGRRWGGDLFLSGDFVRLQFFWSLITCSAERRMQDRQDIGVSVGTQARSWDGYERYPMSLRGYNCFTTDGESLSEKLSSLSGEIFCKSEDAIKVDVFDIDGG